MKLKTKVFELNNHKYRNLSEIVQAMGILVSQIYQVKERKHAVNQKFVVGAIKAFPGCKLDDLFYTAKD